MRKFVSTRLAVAVVTIVALGSSAPAEADLIARVIHSIKHPKHHRVVHRKKRTVRPAPAPTPEVLSVQPVAPAQASPPPLRPVETRAAATRPVDKRPVQSRAVERRTVAAPAPAAAASRKKTGEKLLAGIPVPDKPGFLRSPYTENQAVIDVRGFPSGTPVVDPATGRTFVTP